MGGSRALNFGSWAIDSSYSEDSFAKIKINTPLKVGELVLVKGELNDFMQVIMYMKVDDLNVRKAGPGDIISFKTEQQIKKGDKVYKRTSS